MPVVLLVTHNANVRELAKHGLASRGYEVIEAESMATVVRAMLVVEVDAAVVDTGIGGDEVRDVCNWLHRTGDHVPILFLASAEERWLPGALPTQSEVDGLLSRPCTSDALREVLERLLASTGRHVAGVLQVGGAQLDCASRELQGSARAVSLTPTEFRLLEYLAQRQGLVVSSEELLEKVWEFPPGTGSSELVRSHIRNLRAKIREATQGQEVIRTVPRRGYRLT